MENKHSPSKKKLISIQEEKLIREVDYDSVGRNVRPPKQELLLDLEILSKNPTLPEGSQRVLVSIKPRAPAIKTLYIAEKSRYHSRKGSEKSSSRQRLGIGDHSSFNTSYNSTYSSDDTTNELVSVGCGTCQKITSSTEVETDRTSIASKSINVSLCSAVECKPERKPYKTHIINDKKTSVEKCYIYAQPQFVMNLPRIESRTEDSKAKVDIGTLVKSSSTESTLGSYAKAIKRLKKRIDHLERKILRQEMVFRCLDPNLPLSSSDEECDDKMRTTSESARPGSSYVQQYSHIPETSAFQRYAQHSSLSKAATLDKEHNSEQYGRDFTAYDGITARGKRQCASVPYKQDDFPKIAAERVHKIRHKLNPVRDYRLMDTVHYLAQGEFAPRDDGIKLTPSREAVLSDIIWEDVCRTHWPNARLARRNMPPERCGTRGELQRLIDSLLRERVAHVERRRRRHYRIVKLNHRHESCRPLGKTGDIIVASHKNKDADNREAHMSDHNANSATVADRRWEQHEGRRKSPRSHDRLVYPEMRQKYRYREEDNMPGPSNAISRPTGNKEPTCCFHSCDAPKIEKLAGAGAAHGRRRGPDPASGSARIPRLVIKKETSRNRKLKDESNLEQYILLPTLVIRTPSNVKRQKKFNELYHRILNVHFNQAENRGPLEVPANSSGCANKRDVGFNINVTLSGSLEDVNKKPKPK